MAPDEESVRQVVYRLAEEADAVGIDHLPYEARVVVVTWAARGIVGNGGFRFWYEGKSTAETRFSIDAFAQIGCQSMADALGRSLVIFEAALAARSDADLDTIVRDIHWKDESIRRDERIFLGVRFPVVLKHITQYMNEHRGVFAPWFQKIN